MKLATSGTVYYAAPMTRPTRASLGLFLLSPALIVLAGCGTKVIDSGKAEKLIKENIVNQTGVPVTAVDCPNDVEVKKGDVFTCTAKGADGTSAAVKVTQTDQKGNVNFEAKLIDQSKVESTITDSVNGQGGEQVDAVDCPDVVAIKQGFKYACDVTGAKGTKAKAQVTLTDNTGQFDFKVD